jgi:2-polyprenyl-6-methoxyphenol hydroxylase-like FAD-dependent oxidoreductase
MVIYPMRGAASCPSQLVNWVAERAIPALSTERDWGRAGRLEDFLPAFADWRFDWLDVPALIEGAGQALEFPMVDQEPLPFWSRGRVTLMGDAAHPMVPRGSNGAGQAILDADCLARLLARHGVDEAFRAYEAERLDATSRIVLTNRLAPPDIILKEVFERTGDRPFRAIEEVISRTELAAFQERYKQIAGYDLARLEAAADRD